MAESTLDLSQGLSVKIEPVEVKTMDNQQWYKSIFEPSEQSSYEVKPLKPPSMQGNHFYSKSVHLEESVMSEKEIIEANNTFTSKLNFLLNKMCKSIKRELINYSIKVVDDNADIVIKIAVEKWGSTKSLHGPEPIIENVTLEGMMNNSKVMNIIFKQKVASWKRIKTPEQIGRVLGKQIARKIGKR